MGKFVHGKNVLYSSYNISFFRQFRDFYYIVYIFIDLMEKIVFSVYLKPILFLKSLSNVSIIKSIGIV